MLSRVAGMPVLLMTTTGRRSGSRARTRTSLQSGYFLEIGCAGVCAATKKLQCYREAVAGVFERPRPPSVHAAISVQCA